ncbi:MAG: hypothetical protein Kow009_14340 [Spirochaetales bacterium]
MGRPGRTLLFGLSLGFWGVWIGTGAAQTEGYWKSRLDSELNLDGGVSARWILDGEQSRILYLERRNTDDVYRAVGFRSPLLLLGPVDLSGLLREAGSPLAYGISGSVFRERTGLELYAGNEAHPRTGFLLAGANSGMSLGGYRESEGDPHLFATLHIGSPNSETSSVEDPSRWTLVSPWMESFLSLTDMEGSNIAQEWFPVKQPVPSGPLMHWGTRVWLGMEGVVRGSLTLSMITSRPAHERMGAFTHLYGDLSISRVRVNVLSGYCSPRYVSPKGDRTSRDIQHTIGGTLFLLPFLFITAEGEEVGFRDREVERSFLAGMGIERTRFRLKVQREEGPEQIDWLLDGWGRVGSLSGTITVLRREGTDGAETSLSIQGTCSTRKWEGELRWKGIWDPRYRIEGGVSFSLKGRNWKLGFSLDVRKPLGFRDEDLLRFSLDPLSYMTASLFFSSQDSHLPMKRISGSRVRP